MLNVIIMNGCAYKAAEEELSKNISKVQGHTLHNSSTCCGDVLGLMVKTTKGNVENYLQ